MSDEEQLPDIPEEANERIRAAFRIYRKAVRKAEARMRTAEKQQKFLAGKLVALKEAESNTYLRLLNALDLLGQYRMMFKAQRQPNAVPDDQD